MEKMNRQEQLREKKQEPLVRFLEKTKTGDNTEVRPDSITYGRLPDYTITDYEEEAYIYSYS